MVTVVTVLKSGGDFRPEHVRRLYDQLNVHSPRCGFVCLTDVPDQVICSMPLKHDWPGWWSKIEIFGHKWNGYCLYLDLDTDVVGPIDDIECDQFTMLSDFYRPHLPASGVMGWCGDALPRRVYDEFDVNDIGQYRNRNQWGDQGYITKKAGKIARFDNRRIVSFKVHCQKQGSVPDGASIVAYHGKPRPWEVEA